MLLVVRGPQRVVVSRKTMATHTTPVQVSTLIFIISIKGFIWNRIKIGLSLFDEIGRIYHVVCYA